MKHRKLRVLSLCLAAVLAGGVFAGCSGTEEPRETGTVSAVPTGEEQQEEETAAPETELTDGLGTYDFGGRAFTVVTCSGFFFSPYDVEEENGEVLNDAAFHRNLAMEERFGAKMVYQMLPGSFTEASDAIRNSVTAQDGAYSLGIVHPFGGLTGLISGAYVQDFGNIPHLDFEKPWWNQSFNKVLVIGDILPAASNDFIYFNSGCLYFNKGILAECGMDSPYAMVHDGTWTWDKLSVMAAAASSDLNGDGQWTEDDRYGYSIINNHRMIPVTYSYGLDATERGEDGYWNISPIASEAMHDMAENYYKLLFENQGTFLPTANELDPFKNGNVLFLHYVTQNMVALRDVDFDFGILPMPKGSEEQKEYRSLAQSNVMVVPSTTASEEDLDFTGVLIEALAYESHAKVLPALYDTTCSYKYLRDEESVLMFDIIRASLVYDVIWNYTEGDDTAYFLSRLMGAQSTDTASFYASHHKAVEKKLSGFFDSVKKG